MIGQGFQSKSLDQLGVKTKDVLWWPMIFLKYQFEKLVSRFYILTVDKFASFSGEFLSENDLLL